MMSKCSRGGSVDLINGFMLPKSCKMESRPSFKDKAIKGSYEFDEVEFLMILKLLVASIAKNTWKELESLVNYFSYQNRTNRHSSFIRIENFPLSYKFH